ncbi:unnamed protein product, partial [Didymodactylos carnosus]
MKRAARPG